ncbi:hypothetical protein As57867_005530, partial [Aphanomyces stellatus]
MRRPPSRRPRNLTDVERRVVYERLLAASIGGILPQGATADVARDFGCSTRTVARVWVRGKQSLREGSLVAVVDAKMRGNCGPKFKLSDDDIEVAVKTVPHEDRQTLRTMSAACQVAKSTLHRRMKNNPRFNARSSYVKPLLTDKHKATRVDFVKSFLRPALNSYHVFANMHNIVHVDEKWFYLSKIKRRFYVFHDEELALRAVQSKKFITKVMFMAAVARPRYDYTKNRMFDGKLGVWPFVESTLAIRSSKNRPKGTPITSPTTVTGDVYRDMILRNV